mgnify:CR=1 FL=1
MSATPAPDEVLAQLFAVLEQRKDADPKQSYVAGLYAKGVDAILKKIGEEAGETLIAVKSLPRSGGAPAEREALVHEVADLWFHTLVLLAAYERGAGAAHGPLRPGRKGQPPPVVIVMAGMQHRLGRHTE